MPDEEVKLIEPDESYGQEYRSYVEEFRSAGEAFVVDEWDQAGGDLAGLVRTWREHAAGRELPKGYIPDSRYWLVRGRKILGTGRLRHRLTPALKDYGGHIGYEVCPSERGKGNATRLLALTLERAREMGLTRALVTCDKSNLASARVIEKNGGRLASESYSEQVGRVTRRYWIDLAPPAVSTRSNE
ncbi:MAG TPA: GNAT family N-acetyltransferase [Phycisphaerae bacterium]|nr:GNAT family N-acetyltransferase [Phycisphaerae bacterium]